MSKQEETKTFDYKAIIRKSNGYSVFANEYSKDEEGNVNCTYTTKEGVLKKLFINKSQIAEIEENA